MNTNDIHKFKFGNNQIAYRKFGIGSNALLAFHGFGQSSTAFNVIEKPLGLQFTIYAIDLFFHGDSQYSDTQQVVKTDWYQLLTAFLRMQAIDRFSLLGFSLGGRFALATVEAFADRLDQLILLAPDGITRTIWYTLATGSVLGRSLFQYMLRHLSVLICLGYGLAGLGLLNRTVIRFAEMSLSTPEQRTLAYKSWTQFRLIAPDLGLIGSLLDQNNVRVRFFTGAFDRLVPGMYIMPLTRKLYRYELTVLKTGHAHLLKVAAEQLINE